MSNQAPSPQSTSVMIVDDTKFSSAMIQRMLQAAGFRDIRIADNAIDALDALKQRPAELLLADWLMPGMDGLELTRLVRELNQRHNDFTYVMLLTAKEDDKAMQEAFSQGVDDFIGKTQLKNQLLARVHAGQRLTRLHNSLLDRERQLKEQFRVVTRMNRLDAATGLGNAQFARHQLDRGLQQFKTRSGHLGLILCRMDNLDELEQQHGRSIKKEIIREASQRLQEHSRPLDDVARLSNAVLGLLFYGPGETVASQALIRRLDQAVFTKAYATSAGYLTLSGCIQLDLVDHHQTMPDSAERMLEQAMGRLEAIPSDQRQALHLWRGPQPA